MGPGMIVQKQFAKMASISKFSGFFQILCVLFQHQLSFPLVKYLTFHPYYKETLIEFQNSIRYGKIDGHFEGC
jgi:hypothetical protein